MASRALASSPLRWSRCRGRNGWDSPSDLPDDMAAEAINVIFERGGLGRKRNGSASQSITGDTFSGYNALGRFIPGQSDAAAELFIVSRDATPKILRVAAGTAADELTLADAIASRAMDVTFAVLKGKLYITYDSAENRLHVFDPAISTTTVRRVGLETPAAPTVGNTGVGSYTATPRHYRIRWKTLVAGTLQRQSNAGASVAFTPSGSGTSAQVTRPALPGEGETHWIVEASEDDGNGVSTGDWFVISTSDIAVGTSTFDDSNAPSDYDDFDLAEEEGAFTPWPSVKYILSDGSRLIGLGAWETVQGDAMPPKNGRVWFSPVLDTTDFDDDERVSNTTAIQGWIDLSRDAGSEDRGLAGPMEGQVFVGFSRGIFMLVPTGEPTQPFRRITLDDTLGWVSQWSTFIGQDEAGRPCLYFLDPARGPYRYGAHGLEWLGYDVQDIWENFNPAAANRTAHGVWHQATRTAYWWIATGSSDDPDTPLTFNAKEGRWTETDGVRYGWSQHSGAMATARCSVMFAKSLGATMSRHLKPYAGFTASLLRIDDTSSTNDAGTDFAASMTSKAFDVGPPQVFKEVRAEPYLRAKAASGVTIRQTFIRNYGDETNRTADALLTASAAGESRVLKKFEGAALADAFTFQVKLGDAAAVANAWTLDEWICPIEVTERER